MLHLRGSAALSEFRLQKLLDKAHGLVPMVQSIEAEFIHLAKVEGELDEAQQQQLQALLSYGYDALGAQPNGQLVFVTPRPGTISPWSTKATDIAHNTGLQQLIRIERGVAYYIHADGELNADELELLKPLLHDRMT